jgi:pSer/pThr/pTyr-binding forkhead associated (FHA) protein
MAMAPGKKFMAEKRRAKPHLTQTGGVGRGRVFELSRDILSIGRTEDNEIVMKSESVSRCHAYLKRSSNDEWLFQDNNSKNGVRVNGKKVNEAKLKEGDLLVVGDFTFRFHEAGGGEPIVDLDRTTPGTALPEPKGSDAWPGLKLPQTEYVSIGRKTVFFVETHSWLVGIAAGMLIGGGLWWKASRVAQRPGEVAVHATDLAKPAPTKKAENGATEKGSVSKADMVVSKNSKKPKNDIRDLRMYLREGQGYLKEGDKESAAVAFRFALVLEPGNKEARAGLKAAGVKLDPVPTKAPASIAPKANPEAKARAEVAKLMKAAVNAFNRHSYQEAIDKSEAARKIEIKGETAYLNEAKQIIDRALVRQKEDVLPFLEAALAKLQEGEFEASAALCEQMLRSDPAYAPAKDCLAKSQEGIAGRKAK